jgi:hypothetical protein
MRGFDPYNSFNPITFYWSISKEIIKIGQNKKDKQYNGENKKDKTTQ